MKKPPIESKLSSFLRSLWILILHPNTQLVIVVEIEAAQALVSANRKLIACIEKKIQGPPYRPGEKT